MNLSLKLNIGLVIRCKTVNIFLAIAQDQIKYNNFRFYLVATEKSVILDCMSYDIRLYLHLTVKLANFIVMLTNLLLCRFYLYIAPKK